MKEKFKELWEDFWEFEISHGKAPPYLLQIVILLIVAIAVGQAIYYLINQLY